MHKYNEFVIVNGKTLVKGLIFDMDIFKKMKEGLSLTRQNISESVGNVLKSFASIDENLFEELEEALITADLGVTTSCDIIESVRARVKKERIKDAALVRGLIEEKITSILTQDTAEFALKSPSIVLVIGVNGAGKTTSIGKLANYYKGFGKSVIIAAADTFRAAAIDQLGVWAARVGVPMIAHKENSDPAAVVFDGISSAKAKGADILICDTAGRLHNKKNLMEELKKICKVAQREFPEAQSEVLLVLDATTGQNALQQAKLFHETANITGIILTKLDSTAKGGIIISIKNELNLPVRFVGVGEGLDDLRLFEPEEFARALFAD
ncbi:signal recognition particle-docking protein FtsY [Clostridia bacterium]|nr:signal recognition particle-docking protein FtsY [Clostridia bacterium]